MIKKHLISVLLVCLHTVIVMLIAAVELVLAHQPHDPISLLAVSPGYGQDKTVFIATLETSINLSIELVFKSTDGGDKFEVMSLPKTRASTIAISPDYVYDKTLFIGKFGHGVFKSEDGGSTWQSCGVETGLNVWNVTVSPDFANDDTVYAVNNGNEFFVSTNRGVNWIRASDLKICCTQAIIRTVCAVQNEEGGNTIFIGSNGDGVFKSTDGGHSWNSVNDGLSSLTISCLVTYSAIGQNQEVFAATLGMGIFRTVDGGLSWTSCSAGITGLDVMSLSLHPEYPEIPIVFAATQSDGVFKSLDGGFSWFPAGSIPRKLTHQSDVHFISVAMSPEYKTDQTVFLATYEGFWKSSDGGDSWEYADVIHNRLVRDIKLSPNYENDQTVVMTNYGSGVLRSLDGGESWQPKNTRLLTPYPDPIEFSPNYVEDQTIIVGQTLGFGKSTNNAEFWQSGTILDRLLNVKAIAFFPGFAINNFLLIGTNTKGRGYDYFWHNGRYISHSGVWQSFDGGINWNATYLNDGHVNSLAISPYCQEDGTVFAGLGDTSVLEAGIYKSTDSGTHWTRMNTGTCDPHVSMVHVSPSYRTDRTVFAGTLNDGVIRSLDGGETWEKCPGTSGWVILDFVISPDFQMDRKIFAATFQQGMQVSGDGGNSWSQSSLETNYLTALAISPAFGRDQTVFTASYDGVFRSMDGGSSWDQLNPVFRYEDNYNQRVKYSEGWEDWWLPMASMWHFYITNNPRETAELRCIATNISWVGFRGPGQGMAEVYIDGMYSALVDLYDPVFKWQQVLYESELLDNGYHTIKIVVSENKNPMSSGHVVSVDAFNIQINP